MTLNSCEAKTEVGFITCLLASVGKIPLFNINEETRSVEKTRSLFCNDGVMYFENRRKLEVDVTNISGSNPGDIYSVQIVMASSDDDDTSIVDDKGITEVLVEVVATGPGSVLVVVFVDTVTVIVWLGSSSVLMLSDKTWAFIFAASSCLKSRSTVDWSSCGTEDRDDNDDAVFKDTNL